MGIDIVVDTGRSKRDEPLIKNLGLAYLVLSFSNGWQRKPYG